MTVKQMMRSALAGVLLAGSAFGAYAVNEKPFTVPEVRQWKGMDGTLTLSATSRITYTNPSSQPWPRSLPRLTRL